MKGFLIAGLITLLTVAAVGERKHVAPFGDEDPLFQLTRAFSLLVL